MTHDQPGRLSGILERIQDMQGLPQTGEMLLGQIQQKAGDAPCMAGCIGAGGRVYEDKQRQTHLRLAQGNHGTIFRRSQRAAWPALCPHARNSQHVRAVLPHRRRAEHETHCQGVSFPFFRLCIMHRGCFREEAAPLSTVCARRPNGRRAQRVEKAGAARLFRHAVAGPGALRRGPPVGWHRTYTILRSPGTRRISHAAPSASANTASSQTSAAASGGSAPHSGRNSRSCVWAISQSCAR